jgi:hypothetical protein
MSPGKSLGAELDWNVDGPPLGESCLETRLGGSRLRSFGARRCPRLIFRGAMHDTAGKSKMMPSTCPLI